MEFIHVFVTIFAIYGLKAFLETYIFNLNYRKSMSQNEIVFELNTEGMEDNLEVIVRWFFRNNGHKNGFNVKLLLNLKNSSNEINLIANNLKNEFDHIQIIYSN